MGQAKPPKAYTSRKGYRILAEPLTLEDLRLYRQVWALRRSLRLRYGTAAIVRDGLRAQVKKLERAAQRAGVDWRKELPARDEAAHLAALVEKKRPRRVQVEAPPNME